MNLKKLDHFWTKNILYVYFVFLMILSGDLRVNFGNLLMIGSQFVSILIDRFCFSSVERRSQLPARRSEAS